MSNRKVLILILIIWGSSISLSKINLQKFFRHDLNVKIISFFEQIHGLQGKVFKFFDKSLNEVPVKYWAEMYRPVHGQFYWGLGAEYNTLYEVKHDPLKTGYAPYYRMAYSIMPVFVSLVYSFNKNKNILSPFLELRAGALLLVKSATHKEQDSYMLRGTYVGLAWLYNY